MPTRKTPAADSSVVTAYIDAVDEPARTRLRALRNAIRKEAPDAEERIAYGLATWRQGENLIHLGAFKNHVGVYPGAAAIVAFADELTAFKTSKGAIQIPHDAALPVDLVRRITRARVDEAGKKIAAKQPAAKKPAAKKPAAKKPAAKKPAARTSTVHEPAAPTPARATTLHADVVAYNAAQSGIDRATCDALVAHIATALPDAIGKVWHGHPVWFLEGNPVVGYSTHKDGTRLLLWSGQSFDEAALQPIGKFKAAGARYACVDDIDAGALRRWLTKAKSIQWDYKNIAKNKGVLTRLP